jgi:hypothetical protein
MQIQRRGQTTPAEQYNRKVVQSRRCVGRRAKEMFVCVRHRTALHRCGCQAASALDSILLGQAVIQKLVAQLGGTLAAAVALAVSQAAVERYVDGSKPVPKILLMRAVDLVVDDYLEAEARNRQDARSSERASAILR